jgi:hypothetical protein
MQKQRNTGSLYQLGIALLLIGVAIKIALFVGAILSPLAGWAIAIGLILTVVGLAMPGRR